jgi:HPt (histidine-containing phosphotransfer) domain-containing protein
MTAIALTDSDTRLHSQVWDAQRLASLLTDVGEAGLRDILRLFMADLPHLQRQLAAAIAEGRPQSALAVLARVQDSAEALGLAALAALTRSVSADPLAPGIPDLLSEEVARIRFVPSLQHAS